MRGILGVAVVAAVLAASSGAAASTGAVSRLDGRGSLSAWEHRGAAPQAGRRANGPHAPSGCATVLFVGARGSGESGPGTKGWKPTPGDPHGLGGQVDSVEVRLAKDLATHRRVQVDSLDYAADSVDVLYHGLSGIHRYFSDLATGVQRTLNDLQAAARHCAHQEIVLSGYSQGAMVMHRVLRALSSTSAGKKILARIVVAVLVADGDQVPDDSDLTRYGTAPLSAHGIGLAWRTVSHSSAAKFPPNLGVQVLSICNSHDPVCAWTDSDIPCLASKKCRSSLTKIHGGYKGTPPVIAATDQASRDVLGTPWNAMKAPQPSAGGDDVSLTSVACPAAASCVAVGAYWPSGEQGLLLTESGATWTPTKAPLPADARKSDPNVSLNSVACASATSCVTVGEYTNTSGYAPGLLLTGSGTSWTATEAPLPPNASRPYPGVDLTSVVCPSASTCVAVGSYVSTTGTDGLLLVQSGGAWKPIEAPLPARTSPLMVELTAVGCSAPVSCVAAGTYTDSSGAHNLLLTWSGVTWTPTKAPLPAGAAPASKQDYQEPLSVACLSPSSCYVVGTYIGKSGNYLGLLLAGSGTKWTAAEAPLPSGASSGTLLSVACPSASTCVAVGEATSGQPRGLLLVKSGAGWHATQAPLPPNGFASASLTATACQSASVCFGVGGYGDSIGANLGLLMAWSRGVWTPAMAPLLTKATAYLTVNLTSIACPYASSCVAVGSYTNLSGTTGLLLIGPN
jgi:Cutinase